MSHENRLRLARQKQAETRKRLQSQQWPSWHAPRKTYSGNPDYDIGNAQAKLDEEIEASYSILKNFEIPFRCLQAKQKIREFPL